MEAMVAIGLMSGTSMDGIDVAALKSDGETIAAIGPGLSVPYPAAFRRKLERALETAKAIGRRDERPGDLAEIETEITERHAAAVEAFLASAPAEWKKPELVGFHGQTVLHRPQIGLTVQLGDGPLLARRTGLPVVYDMRADDMALGGQGAPLVPAYHAALAHSLPPALAGRFPVVFVNIGGISNITFVPAGAIPGKVEAGFPSGIARKQDDRAFLRFEEKQKRSKGDPVAFDTGPGNTLIDQWVSAHGGVPFDADGAIAAEGQVVGAVVRRYLENPFFDRSGPKSLDRNDFTLDAVGGLQLADGARTLAAVTAEAILQSAKHLPARPKLWILCGGGRKNPHIVADMKAGAGAAEVVLAEDAGLRGDFTEAEAWAFLAVRSRRGLPLTWPTTTGCREPAAGGVLAKP